MPASRSQRFWQLPFWTSNNEVVLNTLSVECMQSLRRIAGNFRQINLIMYKLALDDTQRTWAIEESPGNLGRLRENGGRDRAFFESVDMPQITAFSDYLDGHGKSLEETTRCLRAILEERVALDQWTRGLHHLLDHQRCLLMLNHCEFPEWNETKAQASNILRFRNSAVHALEDIWQELEKCGWNVEIENMWELLIMLGRFTDVFNRQMVPMRVWGRDPEFKDLSPLPERDRKGRFSEAYPELRNNSILNAVTSFTVITAIVPMVMASKTPSPIGTSSDADFWLLVQSSLMQCLGLFTAVYSIIKRAKLQHPGSMWAFWIRNPWSTAFTALGAFCALVSIPIYLSTKTIWSSVLSI